MAQRVRSIFLSDIHLGTRACQADRLLDFLRGYDCEYLFLVGDIIDFWAMHRRGVYWTPAQNTVVQKILKRARHDVQVVFVPGNHDEAVREHVGTLFGNIRVELDYVHVAADGRRYLLMHGDEFDQVTKHHRWVAVLGDACLRLCWCELNTWLSLGAAPARRARLLVARRLRQAQGEDARSASSSTSRRRCCAMRASAASTA